MSNFPNVEVVSDAVVQNSLGYLRDKTTGLADFRHHSEVVCRWLFAASIRDLQLEQRDIETPLAQMTVEVMNGDVVVIPIWRAGLAMLQGALQAIPTARLGFVGLKRDEETAIAQEYYWNIPDLSEKSTVIITDPMLATGGSAHHVIQRLATESLDNMRVVCVVAAPEGIEKVHNDFPRIRIFTAAIDERLNDRSYIVPGLGDYGDRWAGT